MHASGLRGGYRVSQDVVGQAQWVYVLHPSMGGAGVCWGGRGDLPGAYGKHSSGRSIPAIGSAGLGELVWSSGSLHSCISQERCNFQGQKLARCGACRLKVSGI